MDRDLRELERRASTGDTEAAEQLARGRLRSTGGEGRLLYVTVSEGYAKELFPNGVVVHRLPEAKHYWTYCCKTSHEAGSIPPSVVLLIRTTLSRRELIHLKPPYEKTSQYIVKRVRAKPPKGGWASLERRAVYKEMC